MANKQITIIVGVAALIIGLIIGAISGYMYRGSQQSGWMKFNQNVENTFTGK